MGEGLSSFLEDKDDTNAGSSACGAVARGGAWGAEGRVTDGSVMNPGEVQSRPSREMPRLLWFQSQMSQLCLAHLLYERRSRSSIRVTVVVRKVLEKGGKEKQELEKHTDEVHPSTDPCFP